MLAEGKNGALRLLPLTRGSRQVKTAVEILKNYLVSSEGNGNGIMLEAEAQ